jgi:uncharacterized protein YciI
MVRSGSAANVVDKRLADVPHHVAHLNSVQIEELHR